MTDAVQTLVERLRERLLGLERFHQFVDGWGDEVLGLKQHPAGDYVKWVDILSVAQSLAELEAALATMTARAEAAEKALALQTIDTAPRDGSWFLGFNASRAHEPFDIWHWDATAETDAAPGFWVNQADSNLDDQPTHWLPLPHPRGTP